MKSSNFTALLTVLTCISCTSHINNNNDELLFSKAAIYNLNDCLACEQLLDVSGLRLYPFVPFTDEEIRMQNYDYKLEQRQIPEDFLREMTTKELFYQVVYTDLSKSMGIFNTTQQGFEAVSQQLNMLPELLSRSDAGSILLEMLTKVDPSKINGSDCFWWFHCLQIIGAQWEVINRMTDEEVDSYIQQLMRCHDTILRLSKGTDKNWEYPQSANLILLGLGNVMIRYKFEPFMQTLLRNPITDELIWDTQFVQEQEALQTVNYFKQFLNRSK